MDARSGSRWKWFARDRRGVAAVEMALAAPVLALLLGGLIELSNYISVHYRVAQMSSMVADAIARNDEISPPLMQALLDASTHVMGSQSFTDRGHVIVSAVMHKERALEPHVEWQCTGGGALTAKSRVGEKNLRAVLPGDLEVATDDNLIVTEVFYEYRPILNLGLFDPPVLWKTSVYRPRLGGLTSVAGC